MLIEHMKKGYSFQSFAADINVNIDTLTEWTKEGGPQFKKEFSVAKKDGEAHCLKFWEKIGIGGAAGKIPGFNVGSFVFNMKNRFGWTDRTDLKVTGDFQEKKQDHDLLRSVDRSELIKLVKKQKAG